REEAQNFGNVERRRAEFALLMDLRYERFDTFTSRRCSHRVRLHRLRDGFAETVRLLPLVEGFVELASAAGDVMNQRGFHAERFRKLAKRKHRSDVLFAPFPMAAIRGIEAEDRSHLLVVHFPAALGQHDLLAKLEELNRIWKFDGA